ARGRRRWAWALLLIPAALAVVVLLTVERRHEPAPLGTPVNVRLEDYKVRPDAAVVPAGDVSFHILNQGPTTHQLVVVRTDHAPPPPGPPPPQPPRPRDRPPRRRGGLGVNEKAPGVALVDEIGSLDIDD